jgi:hypothetical protein
MKTIRILILEDDLETLSKLLDRLSKLENRLADNQSHIDFSVAVLSEYIQVEEYINKNPQISYDLILLDRDCKVCGSFHILDIQKFGAEKIIGISSVPDYNEELSQFGVTKTVHKDYSELDVFADKVISIIDGLIKKGLHPGV